MEEERLLRLCRRLVDPDGTEDVQQHQELLQVVRELQISEDPQFPERLVRQYYRFCYTNEFDAVGINEVLEEEVDEGTMMTFLIWLSSSVRLETVPYDKFLCLLPLLARLETTDDYGDMTVTAELEGLSYLVKTTPGPVTLAERMATDWARVKLLFPSVINGTLKTIVKRVPFPYAPLVNISSELAKEALAVTLLPVPEFTDCCRQTLQMIDQRCRSMMHRSFRDHFTRYCYHREVSL